MGMFLDHVDRFNITCACEYFTHNGQPSVHSSETDSVAPSTYRFYYRVNNRAYPYDTMPASEAAAICEASCPSF